VTFPLAAAGLPVGAVLGQLEQALARAGTAILAGPPGSGKTTLVPLALLGAEWLSGQRILVLEPRRLAARAAAERMASLLGEELGQTVGVTTRFDRAIGPATRIEVVTEGVLTRRLLRDPELAGTGIVIFDEFHERSLEADLALALCLELREVLRPDLRLLPMSATLDLPQLARLLGHPPLVRAEGRLYPVGLRWLASSAATPLEQQVAEATRLALHETQESVLVFLPGMAEIRRAERVMRERGLPAEVELFALHGDLPRPVQQAAIAAPAAGRRKIVLTTSIAETSLTIEGIGAVVDSGLARRSRYSPRTGMSRLVTIPAGRANAEQRRGRAGRLGPGLCYRLWSEVEERGRPEHLAPEIAEADLAPLALDLAVWGTRDPGELRWLTPPPAGAFAHAVELLRELGAIDPAGAATPHGREMARLPLHPRLAHMIIIGKGQGLGGTALAIAALLEGRDPWPRDGVDLAARLARVRVPQELPPDLRRSLRQLERLAGARRDEVDPARAGAAVSLAFPERIAQGRGGNGRFRLASGRGAVLDVTEPLAALPWLACAELDDSGADARIRLAAALDPEAVRALAEQRQALRREVVWDRQARAVVARELTCMGALVLREKAAAPTEPELQQGWRDGLQSVGISSLPWSRDAASIRQRVGFLRQQEPGSWPDLDDPALLEPLSEHLAGSAFMRLSEIDAACLDGFLASLLGHAARRLLDAEAPTHMVVPSGSRLPIDYGCDPPVLAVRLQELFGLRTTPAIRQGRLPLMLHLLSPAHRPVAVTQDLAGFWARAYPEVRKELRGRYPKHVWPEDPLTAPATARAKRR
jgi:ATP-dependent helicase HrpB